jgi:hypothetical protein
MKWHDVCYDIFVGGWNGTRIYCGFGDWVRDRFFNRHIFTGGSMVGRGSKLTGDPRYIRYKSGTHPTLSKNLFKRRESTKIGQKLN